MLKKERHAFIKREIDLHNKVLSADLCGPLKASEDTIRRDLQELEKSNLLTKVHGGAISKSIQFSLENQIFYSQPEKTVIAKKAITLLQDGMTILLSGGTTIIQMIKALPPDLNATFITMSLPTALGLLQHPKSEVIFVGNKILKNARMAVGAAAVDGIKQINADLCFLGTNSINVAQGITDLEWEIIEVKRAMVAQSKKVVSLCISEKLNTVQKLKVCPLSDLDYLITELPGDHPLLMEYQMEGLTIL